MSDTGYGIYKRQENLTNLQRADPQTRRNAQQLHAHLSARGIKADHLKSMHPRFSLTMRQRQGWAIPARRHWRWSIHAQCFGEPVAKRYCQNTLNQRK